MRSLPRILQLYKAASYHNSIKKGKKIKTKSKRETPNKWWEKIKDLIFMLDMWAHRAVYLIESANVNALPIWQDMAKKKKSMNPFVLDAISDPRLFLCIPEVPNYLDLGYWNVWNVSVETTSPTFPSKLIWKRFF